MHVSKETVQNMAIASLSLAGLSLLIMLVSHDKSPISLGDKNDGAKSFAKLCFFTSVVLLALIAWFQNDEGFDLKAASALNVGGSKGATKISVMTLSADSWCPYCKKMSAQEKPLRDALKRKGYDFKMVTDIKDKKEFDKLSKVHKARGFPHTIVFKDGQKVGEVPGFAPVPNFVANVEKFVQ